MALSKTLAIALLLTARTSQASAAIGKFAKDSESKLDRLKKAANNWNTKGNSNLMRGAAMAAPLVLATKAAADLEDKIADVAKVANVDFGTKEFKDLEQGAIRVSNELGVSATGVGELMSELAAGGVAADRLETIATMAGKVGVAFDVSAGEAGKAFMTIQNAMNLTEKDTKTILDSMNAATNKYGGKASELLNFMASGGASVANTLKVSGVHMQAFANAMQVVGIGSNEAATTMERFQKAVLTNANAAQIFNKAGGGTKGMLAILEKAKASGNAAKWLLSNGFGEYSTKVAQLANNMDSGKGVKAQLKHLSSESNVTGSSDKEFENRMKTTSSQLNLLKTQAMNAGISIGSALLPVIMQLAQQVIPVVKNISKWISENPELTATIAKLAAGIATGTLALGGIQKAVGAAINVFGGLGQVFSLLAKNPWILVIAAIAGLAYLIYKNWGAIKNFFSKIFNAVWNTIKTVVKFIAALLINFTPVGLIYKHWDGIKAWFSSLWEATKNIFSITWEWIKNLFIEYTPAGLIFKHWDAITDFFRNLWEGVKNIFNEFITWISNTWIGKLVGKVSDGIGAVKDAIGFASENDLDATVRHVAQSADKLGISHLALPNKLPQPVQNRATNTVTHNMPLNITLNGTPSDQTVDNLVAKLQKKLPQMMAGYNHN